MKEQWQRFLGEMRSLYREGAKDLWNRTVPAFPESQHFVDEPGTPLSPTPQMITQDLGAGYESMLETYSGRGRGQEREQGIER